MATLAIFIGDQVLHKAFGVGMVAQVKIHPDLRRDLFVNFARTSIWVPSSHVTLVKRSPRNAHYDHAEEAHDVASHD